MIYVIELHECGMFGEGEKVIGYTQDINVVNNIKAEYEDNDYFYILVKTAKSLDGGDS